MSNYMQQVIGAPGAIIHQVGIDNPVDTIKAHLGVRQAVGAGAGYYFMKKNRYLGALAGLTLAHNAPDLTKGGSSAKNALINLGMMGVGLVASILKPRHKYVAFGVGYGAAAAAVHFGKLRG